MRKAKGIANRNVRRMASVIDQDTPLLGIEPSAILTFRDEYPDLVDRSLRQEAQRVAQHALLIDEFLLQEWKAGRIHPEQFTAEPKQISLHGHCYQKAFKLVETTRQILTLPVNYQVEVIPSGCCGMAGSFGYEKEHYTISQQVAELVLYPTLRQTKDEVIVAAPGTSCRHQIKDGLGRKSFHPVEILYQALIRK